MSVDELKAIRGEIVYFIRHMTFTNYAKSIGVAPVKKSVAHMFSWQVGDILYERIPADVACINSEYPADRAICTDYRRLGIGVTRIVWIREYLASKNQDTFSGIFSTHEAAMTRISLIRLVNESVDNLLISHEGVEFINRWCEIVEIENLSDYGDFSAEPTCLKSVLS